MGVVKMNNQLEVIDERKVLGKNFRFYGSIENPLFLAKDIAEWIEYSKTSEGYYNVSKMVSTVDESEKMTITNSNSGGKTIFLTEDGLYEVLMQSRKPIAKEFKKEVKEILRTIRKHGVYMTPEKIEEVLCNPDTIIKIATALKEEKEKNKVLEIANSELKVNNQVMKPKAEYFDELVDRNLLTNFRETANQLGIKEKDFINFLLDKKYIYRNQKGKLMPYANKNEGLFELKECFNEKTNWCGTQTLVTPKGRETFRLLCLQPV